MKLRLGAWARGAALAAAMAALAGASEAQTVLRLVPHADLKILDTTWTNALITRNHGLMVYDTLFALDSKMQPKPQMVESFSTSADGMTWTFKLRAGQKFHDGSPVTAADAVQSLRRWAARRVDGTAMMAAAKSLEAKDELTFELAFKDRFVPVLETLANPVLPTFVLRAKDAMGDPFQQQNWDEVVGSGPFTFDKKEWQPGAKVVYRKFRDYRGRDEAPDGFAGGKPVHVDVVEWRILPDQATALQAIQRGEVDILDGPQVDLLPLVAGSRTVRVVTLDPMGWQGLVRPNALHPPFDNPKARQAIALSIDQNATLAAIVGDQPLKKTCVAILVCGSPNETTAGAEGFGKPDPARARALLAEAGYKGEPVVVMAPTDIPMLNAIGQVAAQSMREVGFNVDLQLIDWGTLSTRQQRKDKPGAGSPGWNVYVTAAPGLLFFNPLTNFAMATPCDGKNWNGWTCDEELERRRVAFATASAGERKAAVEAIQRRYYEVMPFISTGQHLAPKVISNAITDVPPGFELSVWGLKKK